jgi:hypothetical protein
MIQWYIPESERMVRVKSRVGNVHLFKHLRKSAVIPPSSPPLAEARSTSGDVAGPPRSIAFEEGANQCRDV